MKFLSKGRTLQSLQHKLTTAKILPLFIITYEDWRDSADNCLHALTHSLVTPPYIVRSSCSVEDTLVSSCAGAFLTETNVQPELLSDAINRVFASFGDISNTDEVLIQPMLAGVFSSGVAFSHDPNTCSPYRVINWSESDDPSVITSGGSGRLWQHAASSKYLVPDNINLVLKLIDQLLSIYNDIPLDCEFAFTGTLQSDLWLLQVRPLVLSRPSTTIEEQKSNLLLLESKVSEALRPHPFLVGDRAVFGVMPDWNPAEMIGIRPRPLALSLYKNLITDNIWAYQRSNYGYRNLRSFPLMHSFLGLPYIDVRVSFNSFIPADLDDKLANRLVNHYISTLISQPSLHDKVEFEIVLSCYTLDIQAKLKTLHNFGFSKSDTITLSDSLLSLTNNVLHPKHGLWKSDASRLQVLQTRRDILYRSTASPIERMYWLLEDAKRYGTLPFAGLARAAFIAVQILRSFVTVGIFNQKDYDNFLLNIYSVGRELANDRYCLDRQGFISKYGHLRPGTYDILSLRYDEAPDLYFDWNSEPQINYESSETFSLTLPQIRSLNCALTEHKFETDAVALFDFIQSAIELRELAKFEFTKNVSELLSLLTNFGERLGFSRDDMSFTDISVIYDLYHSAKDPYEVFSKSIQDGRDSFTKTQSLSLPPVISSPIDLWSFEWPSTQPNFITQYTVTADVATPESSADLSGCIICITSADPGFDWLFSRQIAGLVTAWGGANSHMAIRSSELGIPAVIGVGQVLFEQLSVAKRLFIDCSTRTIRVLA